MGALLSSAGLKLLGILGIVVGVLTTLFMARKSGVQAQQNADLKTTLKNVEAANEATASVARLSDAATDSQLRGKFSRD